MSSKLREVTFGTPIVLKVNNTAPDTNGNVTVPVGVTGIESTASGVKKIAADSSCGMTFCGSERHCGYENHCGDISFGKGTVTFTSCGEGGFVYFGGGCACAGDGYGNANILVTAIAFRGPNGEIKIIDYDKVKNL